MIIIFNPTAGRGRKQFMRRVLKHIELSGHTYDLRATTCAGDAERIAMGITSDEAKLVVAAGGDGTIAEVANGLLRNPEREHFTLGILPMGTANVLAHEIGMPAKPAHIAQTLTDGKVIPLHPGLITFDNGENRKFLIMAGAGFDAAVVSAVTPEFKKTFGKGAYVFHTLCLAASAEFPELTANIDGKTYRAKNIVVCNGKHYGGPYVLTPNANISRADFEVFLLPDAGGFSTLRQGLQLIQGKLGTSTKAQIVTGKKITITGHDGAPLQADGDDVGTLPVIIEATEANLNLMVPRH